MDELLKKLLEADVLNEETKNELEEEFKTQLDQAITEAKDQASADVRAELTEQWVNERDALIEAVDEKVGEYLNNEIDELKEDIERFRDLEAEYADKLVEAKSEMSDELKTDLAELVEKIDAFLEMRLTSEFEELSEDINEIRKNQFGREIFEAFQNEFMANYADDDSAEANLRETQERLNDTMKQLEEAEQRIAKHEREDKMANVLSPLSGRQKEVMEAILKNVETEKLEEAYKTFIGRVLRETEDTSEKEDKVLAEDKEYDNDNTVNEDNTKVVNGDSGEEVVEESTKPSVDRGWLQTLAGINE